MKTLPRFVLGIMRWVPAIGLMAFIFWVSSWPNLSPQGPNLPDLFVKKGAHMLGYGLLNLAFLRGVGAGSKKSAITAFALTAAYAMTDELHQLFVPGRSGSLVDVLIDSTGAVLAWIIYNRFSQVRDLVHAGE